MLNKKVVRKLIIRLLVRCTLGVTLSSGLWCLADSPKKPTPSTGEDQNRNLKTIPFFASTDFQKINVRLNIPDPIDGLNIGLTTTGQVEMGGRKYPAGVAVEGIGDLLRIYPKDPITINGIKICGHLGQHAQTLEIFEIKLCEDLKFTEGVIPAGSVVDFLKGLNSQSIKFKDIGCVEAGRATTLKGHKVNKGEQVYPNSDEFRTPDKSCFSGPG